MNSAEVSISGGSDTEASRSRLKDDEKGHARTSSTVKKPTSFKSVSVNKTFLASKGAPATGPSKPSDKPATGAGLVAAQGTASTATPRPRLVAKSGSGLIAKTSANANGGKSAPAPDPNAVWNKNRREQISSGPSLRGASCSSLDPTDNEVAVPPPEPKKFTDEELKKYGIHMATRLHPDDGKGQSNWADIDDDDDDWAPETISWKDGTKIALPHVEEHATPQAPSLPQQPPAKDTGGFEKPQSPAPLPATAAVPSVSPSVRPSVLGSGKGLILKGAAEKPTLVAKPPAPPTPVKSPWAPIPRVDKAATVIDPHLTQPGAKYAGKDGLGSKSMTPPPPKEIAADDFNRATWRDSHGAGNRELFNSQSGRYEPVMDRRTSIRSDQHSRQPALLQRGSQPEHQGPAEPSAAFQTSRVSEQHGPYGRRRGSSNVSGGSGSLLRLKGHDQPLPPPEVLSARRESFTAVSDSPVSPRNFSPSGLQGGPRHPTNQIWPPHVSPAAIHSVPHQPPLPVENKAVPAVTDQDIEEQKRLMHERRELAKQRRLEEEAREEAARKERIRLKLEAMGPAPESRSARMAASKDEPSPTTQKQPGQASASSDEQAQLETPSLIVNPDGKLETSTNGVPSQGQPQAGGPRDTAENRGQPQGTTHVHPWPNTTPQADRYPSWGPQSSVKNLWASPSNDRSLGNGTFISDLGRVAEHAQIPPVPGKSGPGPIAPPTANRGALKPQTKASSAPLATRQPPIGPPVQNHRQEAEGKPRGLVQSAWAASVRESDAALENELQARREEDIRKLEAEGRSVIDAQPIIKDTWRPTKLSEDGRRIPDGPKQTQTFQHSRGVAWGTSAEGAPAPAQKPASGTSQAPGSNRRPQGGIVPSDAPSGPILSTGSGTTPQQGRGSRFFPSRDVRQELGAGSDGQRQNSPSPPPPDMDGHPAFDGDVARPHVSLPRPQPVVRLPPAPDAAAGPPTSKHAPSFGWAAPAPYREHETGQPISPSTPNAPRGPLHNGENNWQARIDSLLGGRKGPPPTKSLPVDSASRNSLEHHRPQSAATISLPTPNANTLAPEGDGLPTSKCMAEECFEEQEMGSLPPIRLPKKVPDTAWQPYPAPKPLPKKFGTTILSIEPLTFPNDMSGGGTVLRVFLPGMSETRNITVPFSRTRSNPRRAVRGSGGRHSSQPNRAGKAREASSAYPNDQGASSSSGPAPRGGGRGGGYRGRDNWSRNSSNPIQT